MYPPSPSASCAIPASGDLTQSTTAQFRPQLTCVVSFVVCSASLVSSLRVQVCLYIVSSPLGVKPSVVCGRINRISAPFPVLILGSLVVPHVVFVPSAVAYGLPQVHVRDCCRGVPEPTALSPGAAVLIVGSMRRCSPDCLGFLFRCRSSYSLFPGSAPSLYVYCSALI
ncbi:hypothetical protein FB45DRAFT_966374 [Roridomyces roridus]|uniref:Uncharacterized protein n=1 Tax=Roridomyces roridus TaxID=1738132 RepID=A0AAD7AX68_9AGAR|nr:hypothetical protein FB45DRAFT_966374 [Roridomyces roridus]